MKVLLFTLEYPPFRGGVAEYYRGLKENWPKPDEIFVLHNNSGQLLNKSGWPRWLPAVFALRNEIKKIKSHVIIGQILPLGTVVLILNLFRFKKNKIPYTVILHGQDINYAFRFKRKRIIAELILKQAKNIICNSNYTAEIVKNHFGNRFNGKLKVVNPGIDPKHLSLASTALTPALRQLADRHPSPVNGRGVDERSESGVRAR